ncbi:MULTISPECIES: alpha/beta hydrolase [Stutzerimonas stutzeri subgroup]|uniref:Alpha/beta hydrolase n=1 Tax=Stutzerimonas stutzeri TaxID=316 RepID=A0A2N8RAP4_STUST|nr:MULTISPECIES: alpha/beta fold hydrolase [Stutzerimonas stutzeri subgroup]EHY77970.1 alpha/beta superfamily hydrolase [Stutzerimonas stutzeri ATCC 14405 = CCUG 16156]MBA1236920.1 alpha/beta fold hydrolase [Stutzerimonas kunmingensis]MCQ4255466.1 alpha/beta fold hydrolase [Stutzerimonas stutzeri]PNF58137.1 alpha/beta hydrolase [Stutzerimonas stutzeri]QOZ94564.1 alpha/beta fold hydrolase [Stutzerimonas stutzeri]
MLKRETPIILDGPCGSLEALYFDQPQPAGLALICHPNPVKGGTMLNKVVSTLQRTARDAGYCTLRFNYRGVGGSAGAHDMVEGEVDDAEAALRWLRQQQPELPLTLLGFSFGGFVAGSLAARLEAEGQSVQRLLMVAPAVSRLNSLSLADDCQLTIIQPEQDEVIDAESVYAFSSEVQHPHELLKVAECGHFFHGKLVELKELVAPRL